MSIVTYQVKTFRVELPNDGIRSCELCGGKFIIENHFRPRKPKEVYACVARCSNDNCENANEGYLAYDFEDLKRKLDKHDPSRT